jgi:hypothetical protein
MRVLVAALLAVVACPSSSAAQDTRSSILEKQRAEKAAQVKPYEPGTLEKLVASAEEGKLRRMISPHNGFFVRYGYDHKPVGSGFGLGGGFRHDLFDRRARLELEAGATYKSYWMARADFSLPRLADEHLELGIEAIHRYHPQEDFYGMGQQSLEEGRVSFLFEGDELQGRAVVMPRRWLRAGSRIGYETTSVGPGDDNTYPSIEALYTDATAPGLTAQPDYLYADLFAEIDYRDEPGNARDGGHYAFTWRRNSDRTLDRYSFTSFDLLLKQFVPIFDKKRVFAFQLGAIGTHPVEGHDVPFFMRPTVGGTRTLRSVSDYRFRDTHAMWLNIEYRWEAFGLLDMALFSDWGKVAPKADLDFSDMTPAYGIGFRFNTAQAVFWRIDIATGAGEGWHCYLKFSGAF